MALYCRKCGAQNEGNTYRCTQCGEVLRDEVAGYETLPSVPNYVALSIVAAILCCNFAGVPAVYYAAQVNLRLQLGDLEGAKAASKKAKWLTILAFGLWLVYVAVVVVFTVLSAIASATLPQSQ